MNEFPSHEPGNEERLQARIVAWVLGEASAFEAEELQNLCKDDAELRAFADEVREIHGLLGEAAATAADPEWRLSGEKRQRLESLLGGDAEIERRVAFSRRRAITMIAACVVVTAVAVFLMGPGAFNPPATERAADEIAGGASPEAGVPSQFGPRMQESVESDRESVDLAALRQEVRAQEEKVEERRKVLSMIVRTKGIIDTGKDSFYRQSNEGDAYAGVARFGRGIEEKLIPADDRLAKVEVKTADKREEAISRGLDAQDYVDAKREFEQDQTELQRLKVKLIGEEIAGRADGGPELGLAAAGTVPSAPAASAAPVAEPMGLLAELETSAGPRARESSGYGEEEGELAGPAQFRFGNTPGAAAGEQAERAMRLSDVSGAVPDEPAAKVDRVRRGLYTAEGNYNLGKFDEAKKEYEEVIRTDPYNSAARRGLERIADAKTDYYRAADDHTRAELLSQVDQAWELSVPAEGKVVALALRSGDEAINRNNIDALLNNPAPDVFPQTRGRVDVVEEGTEMLDMFEAAVAGSDLSDVAAAPAENPALLAEADGLYHLPAEVVETHASEEPVSTFSLNVGDASFRLAQAAVAKGGRPDPAGVRVEQFYNAVDYEDPAPAAGEPIAARIEQAADPVLPGRQLLRVGLRTASEGRAASQPLRLTLLVDQSGSMGRDDRREALATAVGGLVTLLTPADRVTVIGFARTPHLLAEGVSGADAASLPDLATRTATDGGTNFEEALKLARELALRQRLEGAQNRIILFTDGAANLGNADPARLSAQISELRQQGLAFDIAGMGTDELNDRLLGEMARHGNGRYLVVNAADPGEFARRVAGAFRPAAENVKVQVKFNPARVGAYRLVGFDADRLREEDFQNDAVDAAELAADEAGVALYQIETLPDGEGEIGEVSVRFRDTASGEMVERSWTLRYDAATPAFDRASPSLQLAGLAMMAGEKLRGGPLAEAIDFSEFSQTKAEVRRAFGGSARVVELLEMIEAID